MKVRKGRRSKCIPYRQWKRELFASGVKNSAEYAKKYKEHKGWPSCPQRTYAKYFSSWLTLLKKPNGWKHMMTYEQWRRKIKKLGITTSTEYKEVYKANVLPACPPITFRREWKGWWHAFRKKSKTGHNHSKKFISFSRLRKILKEENITTLRMYNAFRRVNKQIRLPHHPQYLWPKTYILLAPFFLKKLSYAQLKKRVRAEKIQSYADYLKRRKRHPRWPDYPPKHYAKKWKSWHSFLGLPVNKFLPVRKFLSEIKVFHFVSVTEYYTAKKKLKKKEWPQYPVIEYGLVDWYQAFGFKSKEQMLNKRAKKYGRERIPIKVK